MVENAALLENYALRGTFFLTYAEINADPALCRALNTKTLFALLPAWQQEGIVDFAVLTRPQEPVSAEFAAQQSDTPQLLVLSENASQALVTLRAANASIELLRETTKLP